VGCVVIVEPADRGAGGDGERIGAKRGRVCVDAPDGIITDVLPAYAGVDMGEGAEL
jgi:hypothetical protein